MNDQYREQNGEESLLPEQKRRIPLILRLTALIVLAAFIALALGNVWQLLTLPSLDF